METVLTITVRGETHKLAPNNLPLNERLELRRATGLPIEAFFTDQSSIGLDSIVVLWWLARRANGESGIALQTVWDSWPTDLSPDEIDVAVDEPGPEADDPEA